MKKVDTPPILLLVFNRPDLTRRVFETIRASQPRLLFVAADGPRPGKHQDNLLCKETRAIVEEIDWPCSVETLFREKNLGCKVAVEQAISWFFSHVESGIILEDDCLPNGEFAPFCAGLLEEYRDVSEVAVISGNDLRSEEVDGESSYYFSHYGGCWGWASWQRAWKEYQTDLPILERSEVFSWLGSVLGDEHAIRYWEQIFQRVSHHEIDSWAYRWLFSQWMQNRVAISPAVNLVSNIGFDERGTHTKSVDSSLANMAFGKLEFPLIPVDYDPESCMRNDRIIEAKAYRVPKESGPLSHDEKGEVGKSTLKLWKQSRSLLDFIRSTLQK